MACTVPRPLIGGEAPGGDARSAGFIGYPMTVRQRLRAADALIADSGTDGWPDQRWCLTGNEGLAPEGLPGEPFELDHRRV